MPRRRIAGDDRAAPVERADRLDLFLGLGWAKQPRGVLDRVP